MKMDGKTIMDPNDPRTNQVLSCIVATMLRQMGGTFTFKMDDTMSVACVIEEDYKTRTVTVALTDYKDEVN